MNVTDEELNKIYKVFTRFLKEIGCYSSLKEYPKSVIKKSLNECCTGRGLFFILSDDFKNAYLRLFNREGLNFLVRKERDYLRYHFGSDSAEREKFIKSLNEIEAKIYNTYIKPDKFEYGKL